VTRVGAVDQWAIGAIAASSGADSIAVLPDLLSSSFFKYLKNADIKPTTIEQIGQARFQIYRTPRLRTEDWRWPAGCNL
jgi:hypothetical protein